MKEKKAIFIFKI